MKIKHFAQRAGSYSLAALLLSTCLTLSAPAFSDGLTATGDTLPIGAGGNTVLTITGSSKTADFLGLVNADGGFTTPSGLNVNGNGIINSDGSASFAGLIKTSGLHAAQGAPSNIDASINGFAFGQDGDTGMFSPLRTDGPANHGYDNGELAFFVNNSEAVHIKYTGDVGIGTSTPQSKLDVDGNVNAAGYYNNNVKTMSILGTVECLTPEGGAYNGNTWRARNPNGAAYNCDSSGRALCSAGAPVLITMSHDQLAEGEFNNFCKFSGASYPEGNNSCHVSVYFCVN